MRRLVTRLVILALVVACGAIAIAHAQWDKPTTTEEPTIAQGNGSPEGPAQGDPGFTAAIPDHEASNRWPASELETTEGPVETVHVIRDTQVQQIQADSLRDRDRSSDGSPSLPPARSDALSGPRPGEYSDTAPAETYGFDPMTPPAMLTDHPAAGAAGGAATGGTEPVAPADPAPTASPPPSELQFAYQLEPGSADASGDEPQGEFDDGGYAPADRFPSRETQGETSDFEPTLEEEPWADGAEADGYGAEADGYGDDREYAEPRNETGPHANPMRPAHQEFHETEAPPESPAPETPSLGEPTPAYGELPRPDDQQALGETHVDATADVPGDESDITLAGVGRPGPQELEGPQSPCLSIRKLAPARVRVGQPAMFQIKIRNVGQIPADRVLVRDEIPLGTTLVDTKPQATATADGAMLWQLGSLRPGEEVTVSMQVTPEEEGPVGSVATVTFQASASARASATKPMLELEHSGPREVMVGQPVNFTIRLANPGSGDATQVILEEDVPDGLSHSKGPQLEHNIGTIPAGATRRIQLSLQAAKPGPVENVIVARAEGGLREEHRIQLEVIAPELRVRLAGPSRRYLERKATFTLAVENPGTAPARNIELMTRLPQALKFVSTNNSGRFDRVTNTIRWSLDRLPAGQFGEVKFTTVPTQMGGFTLHGEAEADMGLRAEQSHGLEVEGIAALSFGVADQVDPIEVGGTTTYEIHVKNQGTKDASNVHFVAQVPPGMKAVDGSGPTDVRMEGDQVFCEPIARLPAKGESTYKIRVEGVEAGDQRFHVRMSSDETSAPVVKEESTRVYSD